MVVTKDKALENNVLAYKILSENVCIIPCDTIYGLVGITSDAENKIKEIKGRDENRPFLRLIRSSEMLTMFTDVHVDEEILALWPGPLTLVVPFREGGTIGLRVPDDPFLIRLLEAVDAPLISTSVNTSGQKPMNTIREIIAQFEDKVDCIVDGGDMEGREPSTVLDISSKSYKILRHGACKLPSGLVD